MLDLYNPARHAIDLQRLTRFVAALTKVAPMHPGVHMSSIERPSCGTSGCHGGLVHEALPLLKQPQGDYYSFWFAASQLTKYLFRRKTADADTLKRWASAYPDLWGNQHGDRMWNSGHAFGRTSFCFPSQVIVDHWREVLARYERDLVAHTPSDGRP